MNADTNIRVLQVQASVHVDLHHTQELWAPEVQPGGSVRKRTRYTLYHEHHRGAHPLGFKI